MFKKEAFVLISPAHVANNFIKRGLDEDIDITPLKLQKLVYFLFVDYLKKTGDKLFNERFETWSKGPVIPSLYTEFSSYGWKPIKTFAEDSQGKSYAVVETGAFKESIDVVWNKFKDYSGNTLSDITHRENTAWSKAKEREEQYLRDEDIQNEPEYIA